MTTGREAGSTAVARGADDRPRRAGRPVVMLVAGEASGDLHGAALARAVRALSPDVRLVGMGGRQMAAAGVELVADVTTAAAAGVTEAFGRLPTFYRAYRRLGAALVGEAPDVVVLIDFPEFNLRLARKARRAGVPVVYFIPPQLWVWRRGRIKAVRRRISLVLTVLPFELALYRDAGVPAEFVGHPLLDRMSDAPSREEARRALGLDDGALMVGLLPGSRREEMLRMGVLMRQVAVRVRAAHPRARFVMAPAPTIPRDLVSEAMGAADFIEVVSDRTYAVMRAADVLLVTSGTATLEAALLGTPMVVCYRVSRLTELMGRLLVRVPWISLVNNTLGRAVVEEFWEPRRVTPDRVAAALTRLIETPAALDAQRRAFGELAGLLGAPGVGERAARPILALAERRP